MTKPKPAGPDFRPPPAEPEPEPAEGEPAEGVTLLERVENLENRMSALEERVAAPPVKLGRRP